MITPEGNYYPYLGGGIVPTPGLSVTWSPNDPSNGLNAGLQLGNLAGGQIGYSFDENEGIFWEVGFVTPGGSLTGFYVWDLDDILDWLRKLRCP